MNVTDRDLSSSERAMLDHAMAVIERLPREALLRVVRHLLRSGLYFRRTKDVEALLAAVRSVFVVARQGDDERYQKHLHEIKSEHDFTGPVDPEDALAALRR
ncbi:hypothetical protein [Kribbella sp. NPDC023855]|uniref:hypothetical protein n=1 Tax=Kribbella sp. NPDC023855 TaxID=3154698 RepID=UPI0033D4B57B